MADYVHHLVAALPSAAVTAGSDFALANQVFEKFGWGPGNFSRKLTTTEGSATATHYLLSVGLTQADRDDLVAIIGSNQTRKGITNAEKTAFRKTLYDVEPYGIRHPMEHVLAFMAARGLYFVPDAPL